MSCSPLGALFANGTASKPLCNREWSLAPQTFSCVCFSSAPFFGLIETHTTGALPVSFVSLSFGDKNSFGSKPNLELDVSPGHQPPPPPPPFVLGVFFCEGTFLLVDLKGTHTRNMFFFNVCIYVFSFLGEGFPICCVVFGGHRLNLWVFLLVSL